jgi:8-oxo-dGTP pyrophosphatase MutT (NUDIX family)
MTDFKDVPIRDAASVILLRDGAEGPRVLMGMRGAKAVFMPSKYVFPGGALDPTDRAMTVASRLRPEVARALSSHAEEGEAEALALAAIRELWEEAGLALGTTGTLDGPIPEGWESFAARGLLPALDRLDFIFRAVTPPGRPRRFDARFFLIHADELDGDPDDFSAASDELSHLHWIGLREARDLALPFITEVVLSEVEARLDGRQTAGVPYFYHEDGRSHFHML